jgi:acetylornithine deacetylase/succinyl-diaminopimelate desuccinylase-like protein
LATPISRIAGYCPRRRLLPETGELLDALVGSADGGLDSAIAELEALNPAFAELLTPLFATTIAPTRLHRSPALNVMPARASVDCDCRLLPGDSEGDLLGELAEALGDDVPHEIEIIDATLTGGSISPAESPLFEFCRDFFAANDPAAVVVPTILNGYTDSHPMREAFGTVAYGVWPVRRTPYEVVAAGVHGADERIHVDDLGYATRFHIEAYRAIGALR